MIIKHGDLITVWQKTGSLDKWGNPSYDVFTTKVSWEQYSELRYGSDGREFRSNAMLGVDVDLNVGDFVARGDYTASPEPIDGAHEVKEFEKVPNWNYKKFDRWAVV